MKAPKGYTAVCCHNIQPSVIYYKSKPQVSAFVFGGSGFVRDICVVLVFL